MTPEEELSEDAVRMLARPEAFTRGREYFRQGRVLELVEQGNQLHARVRGSEAEPYHVTLTSEGGRVSRMECTCPYEWGGACKHAVAALLAFFLQPDRVKKQAPLADLLAALDPEQLRTLLLELADEQPELADRIAARALALQRPTGTPSREDLPPVDAAQVRRQAREAFRRSGYRRDYDYEAGGEFADELGGLAEQARPYVEAGEGRAALAILEAVLDEFTARLEDAYDQEGELYSACEEVGGLLTEALLTAELSPAERKEWTKRIEKWQRRGADSSLDEPLQPARYAAEQGWDSPVLQRVLAGDVTAKGAWEGEAPYGAAALARARLNVLERQGRWEEYLHLAEAAGQTERYVTALVRLGRIAEAVQYGLTSLSSRAEALALARALDAAGAAEDALRVAEHGLAAFDAGSYPTGELPAWTRDLAARLGHAERALAAALTAVRERPDLANWSPIAELVGERWPVIREELLAQVRQRHSPYPSNEVDIFLHEGLIEDAMAAVDASPRHELVERVAAAALPTHPDWVFRACTHQFDRIADAGKSQYYREAVQWLEKARAALKAAGREAEWRAYITDAIGRHSRKRSLRPALERLR